MQNSEQVPFTPAPSLEPEVQDKLRDLTSQSWNLELIISGAALYATLSLPELLDEGFTYYRYNLIRDTNSLHEIIPAEIVGLMKGVCYLLFGAFLVNFVMRAFWIALVGLLAVYPAGIQYDKVYRLSRYAQQRLVSQMGTLPDYIVRLDRRCNVIFAIAFGLALLFIAISTTFILFIVIESGLQIVLPEHWYEQVRIWGGIVAATLFYGFLIFVLIVNLPRFRDDPRFAPIAFRLSESMYIIFLGLYRPVQYIMYTFFSNHAHSTLKKRLVLLYVSIFVFALVVMVGQVFQTLRVSDVFDSRSFMSTRDPARTINTNAYDNLRDPAELIDKASMQADVIREPYIRLFISYPKSLDAELTKRFKEPKWPDSLSRKTLREKKAAWYLKSLEAYFGVYLNDSLYTSPDFMFTQRADNGQRGLTTVLVTNGLKTGRNMLRITAPDSANKPQPYYQLPFWYVPEN